MAERRAHDRCDTDAVSYLQAVYRRRRRRAVCAICMHTPRFGRSLRLLPRRCVEAISCLKARIRAPLELLHLIMAYHDLLPRLGKYVYDVLQRVGEDPL